MNALKYITLDQANDILDARGTIEDGTVIIAEAATVEQRRMPAAELQRVEIHTRPPGDMWFELRPWVRVWGDGVYHYELLVARQGVENLLDANGDRCGFRVRGTNRGIW